MAGSNPWETETRAYDMLHVRLRLVLEEIARRRPDSVFELGCGVGVLRRAILDRLPGVRYFGCDVSQSAVDSIGDPRVVRVDLNAEPLPFPGETFACIAASGVLEYLDDVPAMLRALRARLRPGGLLVVSYFNMRHLSRRVRAALGGKPHRHAAWRNAYAFRDVRELLRDASFRVIREIPSSVGVRHSPSIGREFFGARAVRTLGRIPLIDWVAHQKIFACEAAVGAP